MKKIYNEYICDLHGYLIRVKEIHWNTDNNAEHLLCDEIEGCIHDCEDRFAEVAMGESGEHFRVGDLKPLLPNSHQLIPMLKELESETKALRVKLSDTNDCGLINILDDILENINKFKYRATQK